MADDLFEYFMVRFKFKILYRYEMYFENKMVYYETAKLQKVKIRKKYYTFATFTNLMNLINEDISNA